MVIHGWWSGKGHLLAHLAAAKGLAARVAKAAGVESRAGWVCSILSQVPGSGSASAFCHLL